MTNEGNRSENVVDSTILRMADSASPAEISEALGGIVSPEKVASYTQELLKSKSWLTEAQEAQLIELKLRMILSKLESRYLDNDGAKLQLAFLKEIGSRLDKRLAARDVDLQKWHGNMGELMARAYDLALSFMKGALRSEIDAERWDELQQEALRHARGELEKQRAIEE